MEKNKYKEFAMENGSENIYIFTRFYLHVHKYKTKIKTLKVPAEEEDLSGQ